MQTYKDREKCFLSTERARPIFHRNSKSEFHISALSAPSRLSDCLDGNPTGQALSDADEVEAKRIASELVKMHADDAISGPGDPNARLFAAMLHMFGATYYEKRASRFLKNE
jgi:hypothetical protein